MAEASFLDWDDVGGWRAVAAYLKKDDAENGQQIATLTTVRSSDNIVF